MKILVVFYSLHGHTKTIGDIIAKKLNADVEQIVDNKDRTMLHSWFQGAFDEELRNSTAIVAPKLNPSNYDLVIIGTGMWDGITPPIKAYLNMFKGKFKKVAFYATFHASPEDAFYVMSDIVGKKPIATLEVQDRQIGFNEHKKLIDDFCKNLK